MQLSDFYTYSMLCICSSYRHLHNHTVHIAKYYIYIVFVFNSCNLYIIGISGGDENETQRLLENNQNQGKYICIQRVNILCLMYDHTPED